MKKTIVIKVHPIGSTKNTVAKTPEKNSGPLYKVLPLDPKVGITGRPLEDLRPGDVLFLSGSEQHVIIESFSVTYIDNLPTNKIYIHGMDGSTHLLSEFVVVNEPTSGATPGESRKFDAPITKDKKLTDEHCGRLVKVKKAGSTQITGCSFSELKPGDIFYHRGEAVQILCTNKMSLIDTALTLYYPEDADSWDTYESAEAPQVDAQEPAKVGTASASESEVEARIIKVIKYGTDTISGIPFSELDWGDTFFVRGIPCVNYTETLDALKRNFFSFWGKSFSFDDVDAYEPAEVPQVNVQDTVRNAGHSESRKSNTSTANDSRIVKGVKKGTAALTGILFRDLKAGDTFFQNGKPITVGEDAHLCGDASYDGYLVYDRNGNSYFPEDADPFEIQPQEAHMERAAKNLAFNNAQKATTNSTRGLPAVKGIKKGTTVLTGIFFQELEKGDIFFRNGEPVTVGVGAHKSCDDYVVCDQDGKTYFFEDADLYTFEDMAKNVDYDRVVKVIKNRDGVIRGCLYRELKPGDFFFYREHPIDVKDFAGTFVGSDGVQYNDIVRSYANRLYLPEEMDPYVPEKAKNDKPAGKGSCDGDRIFVKRNGISCPCSVFSKDLNVGDVVIAINANALKEEDFDRCAIVRRDGALATITVSNLQVNDKVLALL